VEGCGAMRHLPPGIKAWATVHLARLSAGLFHADVHMMTHTGVKPTGGTRVRGDVTTISCALCWLHTGRSVVLLCLATCSGRQSNCLEFCVVVAAIAW